LSLLILVTHSKTSLFELCWAYILYTTSCSALSGPGPAERVSLISFTTLCSEIVRWIENKELSDSKNCNSQSARSEQAKLCLSICKQYKIQLSLTQMFFRKVVSNIFFFFFFFFFFFWRKCLQVAWIKNTSDCSLVLLFARLHSKKSPFMVWPVCMKAWSHLNQLETGIRGVWVFLQSHACNNLASQSKDQATTLALPQYLYATRHHFRDKQNNNNSVIYCHLSF